MARTVPLLVLCLSLAGCTNYEKLAREELIHDGYGDVELKETGKGSFDFTATKNGEPCHGGLHISKSFNSTSSNKASFCGPECSEKTPAVCRTQAEGRDKAGEHQQALFLYNKGCDLGDGDSCNDLGVIWDHGTGVAKDRVKARGLFEKACAAKLALGCKNLGIGLSNAEPPQLEAGFASFKKACDLGLASACYSVGRGYRYGLGVAADLPAAFHAFESACPLDVQQACFEMGLGLVQGKGTAVDVPRGAKVLGDACDKGNVDACRNLGILTRDGPVTPRDPKRAVALFEKACAAKDGGSCNELGLASERGQGAARDRKRANDLYDQGCTLGEPVACANLGLALRDGLSIPKDRSRAAVLFTKACTDGYSRGCELASKLH